MGHGSWIIISDGYGNFSSYRAETAIRDKGYEADQEIHTPEGRIANNICSIYRCSRQKLDLKTIYADAVRVLTGGLLVH